MKRSRSISIPELSSPPRRKRALSEEERALWESVATQTKPLRKRSRAAKPQLAAPDSETPAAAKPAAATKAHPPVKVRRAPRPDVTPAAPQA